MTHASFLPTSSLAMAWSAAMTAPGVVRVGRRALALGLVPIGLAAWRALDALVVDPQDAAATYIPMLATLALLVTTLGVACFALGRLAFSRAVR